MIKTSVNMRLGSFRIFAKIAEQKPRNNAKSPAPTIKSASGPIDFAFLMATKNKDIPNNVSREEVMLNFKSGFIVVSLDFSPFFIGFSI